MIWHPKSTMEKVENSDFANTYKCVTKYPHPVAWFLYRTYYGAFEMLGFIECGECEKWFRKDQMYSSEYCEGCYEHNFCECGNQLEEEQGSSPGDGFCARCR